MSKNITSYKSIAPIDVIPSGYTRLEYIESTGTQYIDTGYKPNSETRVDIKVAITAHKDWEHIAYAADDNGSGFRWGIMDGYQMYKTNNMRLDYYKFEGDLINKVYPFTYTLNEPFVFSLYKGVTINGVTQTASIIDKYKDTKFALGINLYLFAGNYNNKLNGDGTNKWSTIGRMYYCKVYSDNNQLYYNLVPAKRNSDGAIGMYDATKKVFLENKGTGSFIAGPVVTEDENLKSYKNVVAIDVIPSEYTKLEYIESTGTQYLNTGIYLNRAINGQIDFQYTGTATTEQWLCGAMTNYRSVLRGVEAGIFSNKLYTEKCFSYASNDMYAKNTAYLDCSTIELMPYLEKNKYLWLFCRNYTLVKDDGTEEDQYNFGSYKVFGIKFYNGNEIIYNLIPAKRNSDGEVGMYDAAKNVFLTNQGEGDFVGGPEIVESNDVITYKTVLYIKEED